MAAVGKEICSFCHLSVYILPWSDPATLPKAMPGLWVTISNLVPFCFISGASVPEDLSVPFSRGRKMLLAPVIRYLYSNCIH